MRFPWPGGRHPWLDVAIDTTDALIGVESKRFEPFRDRKYAKFADTYDRPVWQGAMAPYRAMIDQLRQFPTRYHFLDAAQLVKHALGLATQGRAHGKRPILLYLFAEPAILDGRPIDPVSHDAHRDEIADFSDAVADAEVAFQALSYSDWVETWTARCAAHGLAVRQRFLE